jgi:hypothetical protein
MLVHPEILRICPLVILYPLPGSAASAWTQPGSSSVCRSSLDLLPRYSGSSISLVSALMREIGMQDAQLESAQNTCIATSAYEEESLHCLKSFDGQVQVRDWRKGRFHISIPETMYPLCWVILW